MAFHVVAFWKTYVGLDVRFSEILDNGKYKERVSSDFVVGNPSKKGKIAKDIAVGER
jgi:hypothetical protein